MTFLCDCIKVLGLGEIFRDVHAQDLEVVDPLYHLRRQLH